MTNGDVCVCIEPEIDNDTEIGDIILCTDPARIEGTRLAWAITAKGEQMVIWADRYEKIGEL